ncbi:LysM peptidoglycan-binding domain-containing protein [Heliobacterium gestii]|uniref:LysM peptidoglycan-binding domain-containing protein n=1 Tax=Heliomicrobium gestii TaxID=2699 RepID=A0A845L9R7_HELGE|nr:C40 family peptidase [Heliomicrobium gestii]MBM7866904.1 cell wall-associated NlpC family hydrolase [Heliomicrobium gestii]MZP42331.1 LysM peptidoglycan-binding domain-containing protein [Heliomicrobium gestii]
MKQTTYAKMLLSTLAIVGTMMLPGIAHAYSTSYTVKGGDVLWNIGNKWGVTVQQIMSQNNFTFDVVYPGQVIQIPITQYTVVSGDTFYKISQKTRVPLDQLIAANLQVKNPANLLPGQVLKVPVVPPPKLSASQTADNVIATAKKYLGTRYVYGARPWDTTAFDCSSYTQYVFGVNNIQLRRVASDQAMQGTAVSRDQLRKGDLLFFWNDSTKNLPGIERIGHVGIYIGNRDFIEAAGTGVGVVIRSIDNPYYVKTYVTARRVIQ